MYDFFGTSWWTISSGAVGWGGGRGRRSVGCAIFGKPGLEVGQGFQLEGGRVCRVYISGGLLPSSYFPIRGPNQSSAQYREGFAAFGDNVINVVDKSISSQAVS